MGIIDAIKIGVIGAFFCATACVKAETPFSLIASNAWQSKDGIITVNLSLQSAAKPMLLETHYSCVNTYMFDDDAEVIYSENGVEKKAHYEWVLDLLSESGYEFMLMGLGDKISCDLPIGKYYSLPKDVESFRLRFRVRYKENDVGNIRFGWTNWVTILVKQDR